MRKILFVCFTFLSIFTSNVNSQEEYNKNCFFGFTFEVSKNENWGYGELVITSVEPNSPAEKAGIKVNDIIMEINKKATYLRDNQTIADWLFGDMYAPTVNFTIRNMNTYFKEYTLYRECVTANTVSERELSNIFSFYSLENTSHRKFTLPLNVDTHPEVDFTDYHTYDFYKEEGPVPAIDAQIVALLDKELQAKGLVRDTNDPDIVVQVYYQYEPNPLFTGLGNSSPSAKSWRYDSNKEKMVQLPIIDSKNRNLNQLGQYIVEYGFSLYDRKYIDEKNLTQIWDCKIKDFLSSKYALEEYVKLHTSLMLKQFPYTTNGTASDYYIEFNKYNYTGLHFDTEDLSLIKDIDMDSPAYAAGLRTGYVVKKINNRKFDLSKEQLSEGYKSFISETMAFRDQNTRFVNAEGYADCMYWDPGYYPDIVKAINNPKYAAYFSYLYDFEKYISNKDDHTIVIEAWDGMQTRLFRITPEVRKTVTIKM